MNFASLTCGARARLKRIRCRCLLVMTLLCLVLGENYPFSNFPMFSFFGGHTYYLYLTNAQGASLKTPRFGLLSSGLKKIFDRYLRDNLKRFKNSGREPGLLAEEAAGQLLLHYLDGLAAGKPAAEKLLPGLEVKHVRVYQDGQTLRFETHTVAKHP
jgi:hypothetical protein